MTGASPTKGAYRPASLAGWLLPGLLLCVLLVCYLLPTSIEVLLIRSRAPLFARVLFGDLVGCTAMALVSARQAVLTYLAATAAEFLLLHYQVVGPNLLIWIMDLAPTLILMAWLIDATVRGRNSAPNVRLQKEPSWMKCKQNSMMGTQKR